MSMPGEARERKRGPDHVESADREPIRAASPKRARGGDDGKGDDRGDDKGDDRPMAVKLLLTRAEAGVVQGQDGAAAELLEMLTGTTVRFSDGDKVYPGTEMREINIQGTLKMALDAACLVLSQAADGTSSSSASLRLVVPAQAAVALGGPQHEAALEKLRLPAGARVRVLPTLIPPGEPGELSEQVACLSGTLKEVQSALPVMAAPVASLASEGWFKRWAASSNCGLSVPGLRLALDGQGIGRNGARVSRWDEGAAETGSTAPGAGTSLAICNSAAGVAVPAPLHETLHASLYAPLQAPAAVTGIAADVPLDAMALAGTGAYGPMSLKLLISADEAVALRLGGGAVLAVIRQATGAEFRLSGEDEVYPGTSLQQVIILGPTADATVAAAVEMYNKIIETTGLSQVESGSARLKIIVPSRATAAVIGPGGQVVSQLRSHTQMHVHVEATPVPPGPLTEVSEQVVSFDGPLPGVPAALMLMLGILSQFALEAWYAMWAANSFSGVYFPGLSLFQDIKGAGKGKGKVKVGKDGGCGAVLSSGLTLKLLVPANEASCVLGRGGATVREIGQVTGTRMSVSGRNEFYPGTQLQELKIQGATQDSVLSAAAHTLTKIAELTGTVSGGDTHVEPGGCRLRIVVPFMAAAAIIGPRGLTVKQVREQSGMHVHIEEATIPPGPPTEISEQVVSLSGPLQGAYMALTMIAEVLIQLSTEVWFEAWANHSNCGVPIPGLVLFGDGGGKGGKAQGKGKGKAKGYRGGDEDLAQRAAHAELYKVPMGHAELSRVPVGHADLSRIPMGVLAMHSNHQQAVVESPEIAAASMAAAMPDPAGCGLQADGSVASTMAVKVLISEDEVAVLGQDPATMMQIQQATSTIGMLSDKAYPGTTLQELTIQGPSAEAVFNAVLLILNKIGETMGSVSSGEVGVPLGEGRVKAVVPKRAASAIIGPGGQKVKQIRLQSGIRVTVDPNSIPCSDKVAEQAICLAGPLTGMSIALGQLVAEVAHFAGEGWFQAWAAHSNTGQVIPGLALFVHREHA